MTRTLPWQTPARDYYPLPKVLCRLGLSPGEIAVYSFLMYCENRATYQCYPSYRTIGEAVGETALCSTRSSRRSRPWSSSTGSSWPKRKPPPSVAAYKIRWPNRPQKPRLRPREPLCDLAGVKACEDSTPRVFERFRTDFRCAEIGAGERHWRFSAPMPFTAARSAGCHGGLRDFEIGADLGAPNMLWRYSLGKGPFAPCFQGFRAA